MEYNEWDYNKRKESDEESGCGSKAALNIGLVLLSFFLFSRISEWGHPDAKDFLYFIGGWAVIGLLIYLSSKDSK